LVVLRAPPEPSIPGAFDFSRHAYFQQLGAVGFGLGGIDRLSSLRTNVRQQSSLDAWRIRLAATRHGIAERVRASLPGPTGAVAAALMTGERGAIPDNVLQAMRDSGLAHLLAISGLHIGLVAGLLFYVTRALLALSPYLVLRYPIKKWAAATALCGAALYLLLVGAPVSTQRAFVMVGLVLLAVMLDRSALSMHVVAWAAAVVLLLAPEQLLAAGFQMSFAAVIGLVAAYEVLSGRREHRFQRDRGLFRRALTYLGGLALTSVIATLATGPLAAFHFQRIALYGVAANMLAVPLTAFWIMPWVLLAFLLMPFGLEELALAPLDWGLRLLLAVAEKVAGWPGAAHMVPAMPRALLPLAALSALWLCLWQARWRLYGLIGILAAGTLTAIARPPDLLIGPEGELFAVRLEHGLYLPEGRDQRFERELWLRRYGEERPTLPQEDSEEFRCDRLACIYRRHGYLVSIVRDERALSEDCRLADVVVASVPVSRRDCRAPTAVVDRFDLWREGGHAVWLGRDHLDIRSVADFQGVRPWAPSRR
jgi:competence protein ComEC